MACPTCTTLAKMGRTVLVRLAVDAEVRPQPAGFIAIVVSLKTAGGSSCMAASVPNANARLLIAAGTDFDMERALNDVTEGAWTTKVRPALEAADSACSPPRSHERQRHHH